MRRVYLDTNIVYLMVRLPPDTSHLAPWIAALRARLARGEDQAVVSPLVFDELAYRLLIAAARDAGHPHPLRAIREDPAGLMERHGAWVSGHVEAVMRLPNLEVAPIDSGTVREALRLAAIHRLLPRDALHVAVAVAERCEAVVSLDRDFARSAETVAWQAPPVEAEVPVG